MVATISTRISLEGADDIKKKLDELGRAGQQAFKQIQDAAAKPITDPTRIDQARQAFNNLTTAAQQAGDAIQKAGQQAETAGQRAGSGLQSAAIKFGIAAGAIVAAISSIARSLVSGAGETAQTIQDQADRLGLTIEQWTALRRAIDAAGNSTEEFANSIGPLMQGLNQLTSAGKTITTFANGAQVAVITSAKLTPQLKALQDELVKFGVNRFTFDKGSIAVLEELARIIDGMPEGTAKAAAGMQFFGSKWRDVVESLTIGAKSAGDAASELDNMRRATRELTPELQKSARDAANQWSDLGNAIRAAKDLVGAFLAPGSEKRAKWLTDMVDDARRMLFVWTQLTAVGRADFLEKLGPSAAATAFRTLLALGQQLGGLWTDVLVPAGQQLVGIFESISGVFEGITGSQVVAFFITATIAIGGFVLALKTLSLLLTPLTMLFSPFGAALVAAAIAAVQFWDKIKAGAQEAAALIPNELQQMSDAFKNLLSGGFTVFWEQFSTAAINAFNKIRANASDTNWVKVLLDVIAQLPAAIKFVAEAFIGLGAAAKGVADIINKIFGTKLTGTDIALLVIVGQITGAFGLLAAGAVIAANAIKLVAVAFEILAATPVGRVLLGIAVALALLIQFWPQIKQAAIDAGNAITAKWQEVKQFFDAWVTTPVGNAWQWIKDTFWSAVGGLQSMMDTVTSWIEKWVTTPIANAWQWIKDTFWAAVKGMSGAGTGAGESPAPGMAGGGMIGGRGTGTSDSNLAWVSRGEHIMPAAAVAQPGVLAFLEALRRSGGDLGRVLDGIGRFATGGLVTMPALAGGGLGGMSHVTIAFPGLPEISGLRASSDVVDELRRAAAMAQVRSGGRKPSRYT